MKAFLNWPKESVGEKNLIMLLKSLYKNSNRNLNMNVKGFSVGKITIEREN